MYTVTLTLPNGTTMAWVGSFQSCVDWADKMKQVYPGATININEVKE